MLEAVLTVTKHTWTGKYILYWRQWVYLEQFHYHLRFTTCFHHCRHSPRHLCWLVENWDIMYFHEWWSGVSKFWFMLSRVTEEPSQWQRDSIQIFYRKKNDCGKYWNWSSPGQSICKGVGNDAKIRQCIWCPFHTVKYVCLVVEITCWGTKINSWSSKCTSFKTSLLLAMMTLSSSVYTEICRMYQI